MKMRCKNKDQADGIIQKLAKRSLDKISLIRIMNEGEFNSVGKAIKAWVRSM